MSRSVAPTRITSEYAAGFAGTRGALVTPAVQITTMSFPGLRSERTQRLIRSSDTETYELVLVLDGAMGVSPSRRDIQMSAGDLTVWSSSRPYSGLATLAPGAVTSSAVLMHLPRATLLLPERRTDELLAQRMSSATGVGAVFADSARLSRTFRAALGHTPSDHRHCKAAAASSEAASHGRSR
ncbi:hypothetical protein AB0C61_11290 [Streptomyces sp. NPDC048680]|uniref:AraC-like ligand-binding domain-containing protein n=1 Tax=Streptomyces sp. NPDC048680 TaxID=3155492 RepID=UPI00342050E6